VVGKRQRAGAVQKLARISAAPVVREASWTAVALYRFLPGRFSEFNSQMSPARREGSPQIRRTRLAQKGEAGGCLK